MHITLKLVELIPWILAIGIVLFLILTVDPRVERVLFMTTSGWVLGQMLHAFGNWLRKIVIAITNKGD